MKKGSTILLQKKNAGKRTEIRDFTSLFLGLILSVVLLSCTKEDQPAPKDFSNLPVAITEKGQVIPGGISIQKAVGSGGGTVQSAGGEIFIEIPSGALSSTQTIGIQEITNTAPLGAGRSFRLSPEGTTFTKPVKITMKYGDTPALFAWIVTQKEDGSWLGDTRAEANETAGTVTVETTHFSDWANGRIMDLRLSPQNSTIVVNKSKKIVLTGFAKPAPGEEEDLVPLKPLHPQSENELAEIPSVERMLELDRYGAIRITRWSLDGVTAPTSGKKGKLQGQKLSATYTAPAKVPNPKKVQVGATIEGQRPDGKSTTALLYSSITILDGYYFRLEFDGEEYMFDQNNSILALTPKDSDKMLLQAVESENFMLSVKIMNEDLDFSGKSRVYSKGDLSSSIPNTVELILDGLKNNFYNVNYSGIPYLKKCIPDAQSIKFEPVTMKLSRKINKVIPGSGTLYDVQGEFSVNMYYYDLNEVPCGPAQRHTMKGEFSLQGLEITAED
jgi:hypothetical protein